MQEQIALIMNINEPKCKNEFPEEKASKSLCSGGEIV